MITLFHYKNSNKACNCDSPAQELKDILCSFHKVSVGIKLKYAFEEVVVKASVFLLSLFTDWLRQFNLIIAFITVFF